MIVKQEDYLAHYGVLGMKWGVRRYQNYDGTRIKRKKDFFSRDKVQKQKRKESIKKMTEKELQDAIRRLRLEQEYEKLTRSEARMFGETVTNSFLKTSGQILATSYKAAVQKEMTVMMKKVLALAVRKAVLKV